MAVWTREQAGDALARLERYRVGAALLAADEGPSDGISGALLLALGLGESGLRNVNNPARTDHGCFQINEVAHQAFLRSEPGCPEGSWRAVDGHSAIEDGFCPRFTPALVYALGMLKSMRRWALSAGLSEGDAVAVAVAGYNCGYAAALRGFREGDVDRYTASGRYTQEVFAHRSIIHHLLFDRGARFERWVPEGMQ